jgi:hypothetical protein
MIGKRPIRIAEVVMIFGLTRCNVLAPQF